MFFLAYDQQPPTMDPDRFQEICAQAGLGNHFSILNNAMSSTRMSGERQPLTKLRVIVVLYIMMYSRSQHANWFQLSLARTLQQFGISHQGLASLQNLGFVAHPCTMKASMLASSASHLDRVKGFFQTVIEKEQFIIFCIDDYHFVLMSTFHLQCNIPDISVCKICQEFLTSKAATLGEAANTAVHQTTIKRPMTKKLQAKKKMTARKSCHKMLTKKAKFTMTRPKHRLSLI